MKYPYSQEKFHKSPLFWAFAFSLLLHSFAILHRWQTSPPKPSVASNPPVEIAEIPKEWLERELPTPLKKREKQVVETERADNEKQNDSAFLSEKNQTVKEQTRASQVDDFRKQSGTGNPEALTQNQLLPNFKEKSKSSPQKPLEIAEMGMEEKKVNQAEGVKRDWKTLNMKDLSVFGENGPLAATDDVLRDVKVGQRTILSTREFKYYGYYNRVKGLLRVFWKPNVERQIHKLMRKGASIEAKERTTQLLVLLSKTGKVEKISKLASSGMHEIDQAAIDAFHKAAPFPNPPQGIIDEDGLVRIRWDFVLTTQAAPAISFRRVGRRRGVY